MANDLSNLLSERSILPALEADTRKTALLSLAQVVAPIVELDYRDIFEAAMERERLGSTGVGDGVAIPHTRLIGLERPIGAFARLVEPLDFDAIDDQPCDLIFMLLAPEDAGGDHLRALAQVSRTFRQQAVRQALRAAQSRSAIVDILCSNAQGAAA